LIAEKVRPTSNWNRKLKK